MECRSCGRTIGFNESVDNGICERCRRVDRPGRSAVGVGLGLTLLALRLMGRGETTVAMVILGLAAVLVPLFYFARSRQRRSAPDMEQDEDAAAQIAGSKCPVCSEKILSVFDGTLCDKCTTACHEKCIGQHHIAAHAGARKHPYRK